MGVRRCRSCSAWFNRFLHFIVQFSLKRGLDFNRDADYCSRNTCWFSLGAESIAYQECVGEAIYTKAADVG
jgi:Na+/H+-translocating membrane pyrophosphatase